MASNFYQQWQPKQVPTWLQDTYGQIWMSAHGAVKDFLLDRLRAAVKARFVSIAPRDAVLGLGLERQVDQGTGESLSAFAARIQAAWDIWQFAGTSLGILTALKAAGYPNVVLANVTRRYFQLDVNGQLVVTTLPAGSWQIDPAPQTFWSKFQVLFVPPFPQAWLGTGITSVFHGGTGAGTATFTGTFVSDFRLAVKIMSTAAAGTATYQWSSDHGATWSSTLTTSTSPTALGSTGVSAQFSGALVAGDVYAVAPTFAVPADGSAEASKIKRIVNKWKSSHATCAGYVAVTRGHTVGWPANLTVSQRNLGYVGGGATVTWTP